jgi:hypothetical protein
MPIATVTESFCLEDFMANPPDDMEWVDGQLVAKTGMTVRHSWIQSRLVWYWKNYMAQYPPLPTLFESP